MNTKTRNLRTILYWILFTCSILYLHDDMESFPFGGKMVFVVAIGLACFFTAKWQIYEE